jgi:hypothetical protein
MKLVFVSGQCVQKIDDVSVYDIPNSVEVNEPPETVGIATNRITLVGGVVTVRAKTQAETDNDDTREAHELSIKVVGKVLFLHENRIRVLEGKAEITKQQFINALKAL